MYHHHLYFPGVHPLSPSNATTANPQSMTVHALVLHKMLERQMWNTPRQQYQIPVLKQLDGIGDSMCASLAQRGVHSFQVCSTEML